ncbi:alpha/beta hydrolase [Actinoplanes sp. OR16]|uniref:alpha/beta fold hydrolase n=1 Tax=Actinoplanes sp. OR16 TaxID=946334 RepID=UPI000F6F31E8|nr:alpha/beta hydrolase [Actinoplanes sp. OR16]BBH68731.1 alpha/beta hydrolase [Actinoplanes sp. OR16]
MAGRTYLLVPGAGGNGWIWHLVAERLRAGGHQAITVDLPGADERAGLSGYAEVIVESAGKEGIDGDFGGELVVVAHSMGGLSAPLAVDRLPVSRIVLVNAMIPAPGETGGDWWGNTGQEEARRSADRAGGRDPDGPFDLGVYFFHDVPADLAAYALAHDQPQSETPFAMPWPLAAWPDVPTRVLAGADERFFPVEFQERVARERLGLGVERLPGGHLMPLSRPDELTKALLS